LRFSIKESLYKAMHPLICQYVGFQEAEVQPQADGTVLVRLDLKSGAHKRFGRVTAHWQRLPDLDFFLTSASVRLKDNNSEDEKAAQ
jgi:4'-phosphopantetheinyl transferase EntD